MNANSHHPNSHHVDSKLFSTLLAATLLLTLGPAALRTIADLDCLLAQISLQLCEMGLIVLRVCGI
jgi:hypothetical protein